MANMRQVSKEEFEVLTRFHPGEIRYYVDINRSVYRNKGAKINVKRKPVSKKSAKKRNKKIVTVGAGVNPKSGRPSNSPVQLGMNSPSFREGTKSQNMWRLVKLKFENDPTKVIGRTELVDGIVGSSVYSKTQIGPFVSDCLKAGVLRYRATTQ